MRMLRWRFSLHVALRSLCVHTRICVRESWLPRQMTA
jgi:hypothetical protein